MPGHRVRSCVNGLLDTINDRVFDELYDLVEEMEAELSLRVLLLRVQIRTIS